MTPSGSRPLERFSVLDLTAVRSGPTSRTPAVVERMGAALDALTADGVIEQYQGETQ